MRQTDDGRPGRRARRQPGITLLAAVAGALALGGCKEELPPYAPCGSSRDCAHPSDGCYRLRLHRSDGSEADGKLCTLRCNRDADCPQDGLCLALEGDPERRYICLKPCERAADCYQGFRCTPIEGAPADRVCLP